MNESTGGALRDDEDGDKSPKDEPPLSDSMHDHFFSEGDEGRYEGGPATFEEQNAHLAALEADVLEEKRMSTMRTPEQEARRAKFVRLVVRVVGSCVAVLLVALVWARIRSDREVPYTPPATQAVPPPVVEAAGTDETPVRQKEPPKSEETAEPVVPEPEAVEAAKPEPEPEPEPEPPAAAEPKAPAPEVTKPPAPRPAPVRSERREPKPPRPPAPRPQPPKPEPAPASPGNSPPTASFPVD